MRIFTGQKREYALLYYRARSDAVQEYALVSSVVYFLVIMFLTWENNTIPRNIPIFLEGNNGNVVGKVYIDFLCFFL